VRGRGDGRNDAERTTVPVLLFYRRPASLPSPDFRDRPVTHRGEGAAKKNFDSLVSGV
jgi:hypothetical protein